MPGGWWYRKRRIDVIKLYEILDERLMKLSLESNRKKDVLEELLTLPEKAGKVKDKKGLLKEIFAREKMASTGIGEGVAIPHKMIPDISETVLVFGRRREGVNFDSIDNKPVNLFFLILDKEGQNSDHLRLLSKLARLLHDPKFRQELNSALKPGDIINAFKNQEKE